MPRLSLNRRNASTTDGGLEFDQRVRLVVPVAWMRLAIGTEVRVVTDGTLVADARDVRLSRCTRAERAITEDAVVVAPRACRDVERGENWNESMVRVGLSRILDASVAEIPIRTV